MSEKKIPQAKSSNEPKPHVLSSSRCSRPPGTCPAEIASAINQAATPKATTLAKEEVALARKRSIARPGRARWKSIVPVSRSVANSVAPEPKA